MPLLDRALGIHQQALPLRNARISTLAANIANADTPGYRAKDIDFAKAIKAHMGQGAMAVTNKKHFRHPSVSTGSFPIFFERHLTQVLMGTQLKSVSSKPNLVVLRVVMKQL